ncbi:MAG: hypothetical protein J6C82_04510 [Clostridia bacterium]|nr:hypothetical protein [Clostridia bacterium]
MGKDNMKKEYSTQYKNLYKFISNNRIPNNFLQAIELKLDSEHETYAALVVFLSMILSVISGVICLFTPWKKGTLVAFLVLICLIVLFKKVIIENKHRILSNLEKGDRIFLEQKRTFHYVVAGFYYYQAKELGSELPEKRLLQLLEMPEFLKYFSENGLAYSKEMTSSSWRVDEYRKFVTDYYGRRLDKPNKYELFYKSNALMLDSQIKLYDECDCLSEIEEGDLYSVVKRYHSNWCCGDIESRELFEKNYLNKEVMRGYEKAMEEMCNFFEEHPGLHPDYSPYTRAFFDIIESVSKEKFTNKTE